MVIKNLFLMTRVFFTQLRYFIGFCALFTGIWEVSTGEFTVVSWLLSLTTVSLKGSPFVIASSLFAYFKIKKRVTESGDEWDSFLQLKRPDQDRRIWGLGFGAFYFVSERGNSGKEH